MHLHAYGSVMQVSFRRSSPDASAIRPGLAGFSLDRHQAWPQVRGAERRDITKKPWDFKRYYVVYADDYASAIYSNIMILYMHIIAIFVYY